MLYFRFSYDHELKTTGAYPQRELMTGYDPSLKKSHWNVKRDEFLDFEVEYKLEITKGAWQLVFYVELVVPLV